MNAAGIDLLKDYEGFRADAYLDMVGVLTIGYGFTKGVNLGDHMTSIEADARLKQEVSEFETGVLDACTNPPTPNQGAAMTCLAYNIGLGAFKGSTVLRKHNAGDLQGAADAFQLWCRAGGKVALGLVNRRQAERQLYLS